MLADSSTLRRHERMQITRPEADPFPGGDGAEDSGGDDGSETIPEGRESDPAPDGGGGEVE